MSRPNGLRTLVASHRLTGLPIYIHPFLLCNDQPGDLKNAMTVDYDRCHNTTTAAHWVPCSVQNASTLDCPRSKCTWLAVLCTGTTRFNESCMRLLLNQVHEHRDILVSVFKLSALDVIKGLGCYSFTFIAPPMSCPPRYSQLMRQKLPTPRPRVFEWLVLDVDAGAVWAWAGTKSIVVNQTLTLHALRRGLRQERRSRTWASRDGEWGASMTKCSRRITKYKSFGNLGAP
ncbi:hypothetical protein BV22DRAFT_76166 [Leucogyrophana mollusca]|uniref:Uncharacterized protein n=1 Tax=Leucogyrophana mollusca TaxID=85980 RepID=A0ACB8BXB6_9AGAM|nr:hypothetical protein BV22DRAFT_76166 [Leucogyrophana mollusca]